MIQPVLLNVRCWLTRFLISFAYFKEILHLFRPATIFRNPVLIQKHIQEAVYGLGKVLQYYENIGRLTCIRMRVYIGEDKLMAENKFMKSVAELFQN